MKARPRLRREAPWCSLLKAAKAKLTRAKRGTLGSRQKLAVKTQGTPSVSLGSGGTQVTASAQDTAEARSGGTAAAAPAAPAAAPTVPPVPSPPPVVINVQTQPAPQPQPQPAPAAPTSVGSPAGAASAPSGK